MWRRRVSCAGDHLLTVVCLFSREWAWAVEMRASRARARDSLPGIVLQHRDMLQCYNYPDSQIISVTMDSGKFLSTPLI